MTACELCSGRHATSTCAIGRTRIEECMGGTPDDYHPLPGNVIRITEARIRRSAFSAEDNSKRRAEHKRRAWHASRSIDRVGGLG